MLLELLCRYTGRIGHNGRSSNILARISLCRTVALGRHLHRCLERGCDGQTILYNSCGERHCPLCSGGARANWVERTAVVLLDGVEYYQVVFTVSDLLSDLILSNCSLLYNGLMRSVWKALSKFLRQHDLQPAAVLVLHTWNQRLKHHPHIHCLVPVSSLSLDGKRWVTFNPYDDEADQLPKTENRKLKTDQRLAALDFQLGQRFRTIYVKSILKLMKNGELQLPRSLAQYQTVDELKAWLDTVSPQWFRVFLQPPPVKATPLQTSNFKLPTSSSSPLMNYLAGYLGGGPISDKRLIKIESVNGVEHVYFYARPEKRDQSGTESEPTNERGQVIVSLPALEFVQRWAIHILPKAFVAVRHFGMYGNRKRTKYLELCRKFLGLNEEGAEQSPCIGTDSNSDQEPIEPAEKVPREGRPQECPKCGKEMSYLSGQRKTPWPEVFTGPDCPAWYRPWYNGSIYSHSNRQPQCRSP